MNNLLPKDFNCSDAVRQTIVRKLAAFEAVSDELPVYIIHDVRDFSVVYLSGKGLKLLGATLDEVRKMGPAYFARFFNPDEVSFALPAFTETMQQPRRRGVVFPFPAGPYGRGSGFPVVS